MCVLPPSEQLPLSQKHAETDTSSERVGSETRESVILSTLHGIRGTIGCGVKGPRKAVCKMKKAVGCGEQSRGSDERVTPVTRKAMLRGSGDVGSCREQAAARSGRLQKLKKVGGCGGRAENWSLSREMKPTQFDMKRVPKLESNRPKEQQNWSKWEKVCEDVGKALVLIPEPVPVLGGSLDSFRLLATAEEAQNFIRGHDSYVVIFKPLQALFKIHCTLSSCVAGINIIYTCNDKAASALLRGNTCSYAVVTPQRVIKYKREAIEKEDLRNFLKKILRDES